MIVYRYYFLGEDGKIKSAEVIECPTDAAAVEEAIRKLATCGYPAIEIWDKGRRIGIVGDLKENCASDVYATVHILKPHAASVGVPREVKRRSSQT